MSKTKKIISMLLAIAMVLTMMPISSLVLAYDTSTIDAPNVSGVTWSQPTVKEMDFSIDTSATTEVLRVAAGEGSFSLGIANDSNAPYTIVPATPSGVPQSSGQFAHISYAGETPVQPTVKFSITGVVPDEDPTVVPDVTGISFGKTVKTTSGDTTTYSFPVTGSAGDIAPHKNVVFTITFKVDKVLYTAYAYSHIENIIVMNGFVRHHYRQQGYAWNYTYVRYSAVGQFQSKNMYTRMNGDVYYDSYSGETLTDSATVAGNRKLGYINYASGSAYDGGALKGCGGSSGDLATDIDAYASVAPNDAIAGNEQAALIKSVIKPRDVLNDQDPEYGNMCYIDDTNRGEPIIYMDYEDTLDSLNFRFTLQNTESDNFGNLALTGFTFWAPGAQNYGDEDSSVSATNVSQDIIKVSGYTLNTATSSVTGQTISSTDFNYYVMAKFAGKGPKAAVAADTKVNTADTALGTNQTYVIVTEIDAQKDQHAQSLIGMNIAFRHYDTRDLRKMYEGALSGVGSDVCVTPAFNGTPLTFNKGVFPREAMYKDAITAKVQAGEVLPSSAAAGGSEKYSGDEFTRYINAMKVAGSVLAEPDTNQDKIDAAAVELYFAYMDLPTPSATVDVKIRLCDNITKQPLVKDGKQLIMTIPDVPMNSTVDINAATVAGYKTAGEATKKIEVTGAKPEIVHDFFYDPMNYTIMYYYNNSVPSIEDSSVMTDSDKLSKAYNSTIDLDAVNVGSIEHYTFAGWYLEDYTDAEKYADSFNNIEKVNDGTSAADHTVTADEDFYAIWKITPLKVNVTPVTNTGVELTANKGTVATVQLTSEDDVKQAAKPADYKVDGYLFGGYYENYDASTGTFSNPVSWPVSFAFGDSNKEIYARMVDVNGRISFNSNGGSDVPDVEFTATDAAPATVRPSGVPTKKGYTFKGWFNEDGSRQYFTNGGTEANGWIDGTETLTNMTGFLAYAQWEPNEVCIRFDLGTPSTAFDTNEIGMVKGKAEQPIPEGNIPPAPVKFGKSFAQWVIQGTNTVFDFTTYPLEDIVLEPIWNDTKYSAFISLGASEKLSGEYVDIVKAEASGDERKGQAQKGDIVTFRMTSQTNFYTGSSVFVIMYDKNFYELIGSGSDAFILNENNEYVAGIDAKHIGVTDSSLFTSNGKWPDGISSTTYNAMMVTIDPTVTSNNHNCEPMADGTWLIEFQLRVKDTASGEGVVYMDNKWTRTADNIMGTMFYGWAETKDTSVADTTNNVVEPNLDKAIVTLTIDETPQVEVEITVNPNGGAWADGSTAAIVYKGNAETEILDYVSPSREGYEFKVSNGKNLWTEDAEGTSTNTWAEGYYGKEEQKDDTFYAQWQAIEYDVVYYVEEGGEIWDEEKLPYESPIDGPMYDIKNAKQGYDFSYWYYLDDNDEEVKVTLGTTPVPLGGVELYAKWVPGEVDITVIVNYFNNATQKDATQSRTMTGITGKNLYVVETEGTDVNGIYIKPSSLPIIVGYEFDTANDANKALATTPVVIKADGTTEINVYYKATTITYTFDANGGVYDDNLTTQVISGEFQTSTVEKQATLKIPTRDGYDFNKWNANKSFADQGTSGNVNAKFTTDTTYYAVWTPMSRTVLFNANGGTFADNTTETSVSSTYGKDITTPTAPTREGYDFLGWNTTASATEALADLGTMDSTVDNEKVFYAVWKIRSHDVTYTVDGVTDTTLSQNVEYGKTVTVAAEPADIKGYSFDGWYYNNTKYAAGSTLTMPDSAVVFKGTFDADTFDVKFDANGGAWSDDSTLKTIPTVFDSAIDTTEVGLTAADPNAPTRQGFEFQGWAESKDSNTTVNPGTLTDEGKTYYAVWKATIWTYTVEIYEMDLNGDYQLVGEPISNSGQVASTVEYEVPAKTGFSVDTVESTNYNVSTNKVSGTVTVDPALVLKVYYSRNKHTLTWVENLNNSTVKTEELYYGETIKVPDYTVDGYDVALDTTDTTMPDNDLTITFVHTAKKYDVIFNAGEGLVDGASTKTINASYNSTLQSVYNNIITVEREGYALTGWSYAENGAVIDLATETVPVGGTTLYAVWAIQSYAVNFRAGNGTFEENGTNTYATTVTYGQAIPAPKNPTRTGWKFTGWSPAVPATMPAAIQNFTAQWAQEIYNVVFNIDGTEIPEAYKYGDTIVVPDETQTVKTGYTFQYWTDVDPSTVEGAPAEVDIPAKMEDIGETGATVTYYAYFKVDSHNVTWLNEDGSTHEGPTSYEYEAPITLPATNPTKTGWTFKGWKAADGTLYTTAVPAMGTADVSYTAYFEIDSHNVTWLNEDGSTFEGPTSYNYQAEIKLPATNPTKTGWTFKGWKAADGTLYTTAVPVMGTADVSYTAYFEIDSHNVTWYDEDGTTVLEGPTSYNYQAEITLPATNPTKTGWTFKGWKSADDTLYTTAVPVMGTADVSYKAYYEIDTYTVTWDYNGDDANTADKVDNVVYGQPVNKPSNPTKTGYNFLGWMGSDGILYAVGQDVPAMGAGDVTYTAEWGIQSYTVTWLNEDGKTTFDSGVYDYMEAVSKPATNPVKEGWTFTGWKAADGKVYGENEDVPAMGTANVSYTAYFVINQYVIVFDAVEGAWAEDTDADGSKSTYTIEQDYNSMATQPGKPSREGYTFAGWATTKGGAVVDVPATWYVAAENVNYYAVWTINQYTVTFLNAEGEAHFTVSLDYGTVIQSPEAYAGYTADPTLEYYTFEGWSLTEVELGQFEEDVAPSVIDFATANIKVPENGITIYPAFARVVVTLAAIVHDDGTSAVIETVDGTSDPIEGYITGLQTKLSKAKLLSTYLTVEGDGRLEVTLTKYKVCGTGAKVDVYDRMGTPDDLSDDKLVETYTIIIYGDVNGDSAIDATDSSMIGSEVSGLTYWSDEDDATYEYCKVVAADLDGNGYVESIDATMVDSVTLMVASVDQQTGKVTSKI